MNMVVVIAAMIYMLLKQYYSDKASIPKQLAQSVCEFGFQSVPRFSHIPLTGSLSWCNLFRWNIVAANKGSAHG